MAALGLFRDRRTLAAVSPNASVQWRCSSIRRPPVVLALPDGDGGTARLPELEYVDAGDAPAAATAKIC